MIKSYFSAYGIFFKDTGFLFNLWSSRVSMSRDVHKLHNSTIYSRNFGKPVIARIVGEEEKMWKPSPNIILMMSIGIFFPKENTP